MAIGATAATPMGATVEGDPMAIPSRIHGANNVTARPAWVSGLETSKSTSAWAAGLHSANRLGTATSLANRSGPVLPNSRATNVAVTAGTHGYAPTPARAFLAGPALARRSSAAGGADNNEQVGA